jgi:hypothetical protein
MMILINKVHVNIKREGVVGVSVSSLGERPFNAKREGAIFFTRARFLWDETDTPTTPSLLTLHKHSWRDATV